jgi:hypothetical protein
MIHIKLYDNFQFDFNGQYYIKIDKNEYGDFYNSYKIEHFTDEQITAIKNIASHPSYTLSMKGNTIQIQLITGKAVCVAYIDRMVDEIYQVTTYIVENGTQLSNTKNDYYICDQFDGLIHFLKILL